MKRNYHFEEFRWFNNLPGARRQRKHFAQTTIINSNRMHHIRRLKLQKCCFIPHGDKPKMVLPVARLLWWRDYQRQRRSLLLSNELKTQQSTSNKWRRISMSRYQTQQSTLGTNSCIQPWQCDDPEWCNNYNDETACQTASANATEIERSEINERLKDKSTIVLLRQSYR